MPTASRARTRVRSVVGRLGRTVGTSGSVPTDRAASGSGPLAARPALLAAAVAWSALLASVVIGPMAGRGWVLLLDWVTGPRVPLAENITRGGSLPAGPVFFGLAAAVRAVAGPAVGWLVPWLALVTAGIGGARLGARISPAPAPVLVSATAAAWNPFLHERLYAGQLAMVLGAALLPHVLCPLIDLCRPDDRSDRAPARGSGRSGPGRAGAGALRLGLVWALTAAATIQGAVFGAVAVAVAAVGVAAGLVPRPQRRQMLAALVKATVVAVLLTGAWLLPRLGSAPEAGDASTVRAFATRPDPRLGYAGGAALQRGFWRPSPGEPSSDRGWWWPVAGVSLGLVAVAGLVDAARRPPDDRPRNGPRPGGRRPDRRAGPNRVPAVIAAGSGVTGWVLGMGPTGPTGALVRSLLELPGSGVMREAGKFLVLLVPTWCVGLAAAADALTRTVARASARVVALRPGRPGRPTARLTPARVAGMVAGMVAVVALAAAPVLLTPGLAGGVGGRLAAVRYPVAWEEFRAVIAAAPSTPGSVVVEPFAAYGDPGFTGGRIVRSPARAFFGRVALLSDDPVVAGLVPSPRTRAVAAALAAPDAGPRLARLGIGWVIRPPVSADGVAPGAPRPGVERVLDVDGWVLERVTAAATQAG